MEKIKEKDYSIANIYNELVEQINSGNFNLNDISDFTYDIEHKLEVLNHISWKKTSIINLNFWLYPIPEISIRGLSLTKKSDSKKRENDFQEFCNIRAKILCYFLPKFYEVYYHTRKQEYILRDFSKACLLNNFTKNDPISIVDLVDKYNEIIRLRNKPIEYFIWLDYSEDQNYLNNNED